MSTEGFMGVCRGCGEEIYAPMIRCGCPSEEEVEATMSDEWRQAIHDAEYEEQAIERGVDVTYYREVKCRFCGRREIVGVGLEQYSRFLGGRGAAETFPQLTEDLRSLFDDSACGTKCCSWRTN